jgi:hypothetical protein
LGQAVDEMLKLNANQRISIEEIFQLPFFVHPGSTPQAFGHILIAKQCLQLGIKYRTLVTTLTNYKSTMKYFKISADLCNAQGMNN